MRTLLRLLSVTACVLAMTQTADALSFQDRLGAGIFLGGPTGLSAKYYLDRDVAVDAGLAFDIDDYVFINGDYLKHFPGALGSREKFFTELTPYFGAGVFVVFDSDNRERNDRYFAKDDDDFGVGARFPLGIEWLSQKQELPLGIALEITPSMTVIPGTDFHLQGGVAFRYYF